MAEEFVADVIPVDGVGDPITPPEPIGLGKPLSIKILSMYPGFADHRNLLVSSAVKSVSTYDAQPRAMHYVFEKPATDRPLHPEPTQAGSPYIFYSPAVLDSQLDVQIKFSFDDFDLEQANAILEVAGKIAELPVFAVSTTLGGLAGPAAGRSALYFAKNAVKLALKAIDSWVDDDDRDWVSTWSVSLDPAVTGLAAAPAGYVLFYADGSSGEVVAPLDGDLNNQVMLPRNKAYRVDTKTGQLVHADDPTRVVTDEPYVLTYVNGAKQRDLDGWKATAVTAALTKKYFGSAGPRLDDLGSLLSDFNDATMARRYGETKAELSESGLSEAEQGELKAKMAAYLKNIQSKDIRDIVEG